MFTTLEFAVDLMTDLRAKEPRHRPPAQARPPRGLDLLALSPKSHPPRSRPEPPPSLLSSASVPRAQDAQGRTATRLKELEARSAEAARAAQATVLDLQRSLEQAPFASPPPARP